MKYLVIAAHPDDEILGCGGSMAKWCKDGHIVHVLIMAEGATSRYKSRDRVTSQKELSHLARSAKKAGEILGIASVELLNYPDNRMDSVDLLDVVKSVEEHIDKNKPDGQFRKDVDSSKLLDVLDNFEFTPLGKGIRKVYDNFGQRYNR